MLDGVLESIRHRKLESRRPERTYRKAAREIRGHLHCRGDWEPAGTPQSESSRIDDVMGKIGVLSRVHFRGAENVPHIGGHILETHPWHRPPSSPETPRSTHCALVGHLGDDVPLLNEPAAQRDARHERSAVEPIRDSCNRCSSGEPSDRAAVQPRPPPPPERAAAPRSNRHRQNDQPHRQCHKSRDQVEGREEEQHDDCQFDEQSADDADEPDRPISCQQRRELRRMCVETAKAGERSEGLLRGSVGSSEERDEGIEIEPPETDAIVRTRVFSPLSTR